MSNHKFLTSRNSVFIFGLILVSSCNNTPITRGIKANINEIIKLEMFDSVRQNNDLILYSDFRKMYRYISIVYLEDGCNPCYSKFIEWQNKVDSLNKRNDYTVLFVIHGFTYEQFIRKVKQEKDVEDHYYTIIDKDLKYLLNNNNIPRWIIDRSVLINDESKIKMIGDPWASPNMTELFVKICEQE